MRSGCQLAGAIQYDEELDDIQAEIAFGEWNFDLARAYWERVAQRYLDAGHSKGWIVVNKLNRLPRP